MSQSPKPLVLVTGASGFVGQALVPALAAEGWRVRAASRDPASVPAGPMIQPATQPDLNGPADWEPLLDGVQHVVHLAAIAHTSGIPENSYMRVNAEASGTLARAARAAGIERFVFLSSVRAQSGPTAEITLTETMPAAPTDAYGRSKLTAEGLVASGFGSAATLLRPVLVLGPGVKGNLALLLKLAALPVPPPLGSLHNRRSLLGVQNLASMVGFALGAPAPIAGVYLAADADTMTVAELVAELRSALGRSRRLMPFPPGVIRAGLTALGRGAVVPSLLGNLVVDTRRLSAAGWRPVASTQDEIIRLVASK